MPRIGPHYFIPWFLRQNGNPDETPSLPRIFFGVSVVAAGFFLSLRWFRTHNHEYKKQSPAPPKMIEKTSSTSTQKNCTTTSPVPASPSSVEEKTAVVFEKYHSPQIERKKPHENLRRVNSTSSMQLAELFQQTALSAAPSPPPSPPSVEEKTAVVFEKYHSPQIERKKPHENLRRVSSTSSMQLVELFQQVECVAEEEKTPPERGFISPQIMRESSQSPKQHLHALFNGGSPPVLFPDAQETPVKAFSSEGDSPSPRNTPPSVSVTPSPFTPSVSRTPLNKNFLSATPIKGAPKSLSPVSQPGTPISPPPKPPPGSDYRKNMVRHVSHPTLSPQKSPPPQPPPGSDYRQRMVRHVSQPAFSPQKSPPPQPPPDSDYRKQMQSYTSSRSLQVPQSPVPSEEQDPNEESESFFSPHTTPGSPFPEPPPGYNWEDSAETYISPGKEEEYLESD